MTESLGARHIPRYPDDVTADWLTHALGSSGETVTVDTVDVQPVGTGQTGATYRITARYADNPAGFPATFIVKLPALDEAVRAQCKPGYRCECAFYTSVAPVVRIPIPQHYYSEIMDDGGDYALLLEDQAPAQQGDQLAGCNAADAHLVVRALAGLHAPTWCDQKWRDFPGLAMALSDDDAVKMLGDIAGMAAGMTVEKLGAKLPAEDAQTLVDTMSVATPWLRGRSERFALVHGDYRLDNMLFSPDHDRVWVVDWQTLGVGLPTRDLAFFTGTSLQPQVRAEIERDLVATYHGALTDLGVTGYDLDTCWDDYRYGLPQALLTTALGCAFAAGTERGVDMFAAMLARGCRAIRELGTLDLIK